MLRLAKDHRLKNASIFIIGYILSPLSWWNDLVINAPLSYALSLPFSLINESFFLAAFVFSYWLSNLLGFLLMHWSGQKILLGKKAGLMLKHSMLVSLLYSIIMIIVVLMGWLPPPTEYINT